jgi:hypothetical protein
MREYYVNADFDSTLSGEASPDTAYLREVPWHFLFAADKHESIILAIPLPPGFGAYVAAKGLVLPHIVVHPGFTRAAEFIPFGWNAQALALASRYARHPQAPELAIVKAANARAFALALEREWFPDTRGRLISDLPGVAAFLATRPAAEAWVAKGEHGYAGTGNRRLPGGPLSSADTLSLASLFAMHGRVVLEPWHERLSDLAMLFTVSPEGEVGDFRGHRLLNSRDGAFLGAEISPERIPPAPWSDALRGHAGRLAQALSRLGYSGPVGVDAYVHGTPEGPRLRPLVDLNARLSMAMPAHGLARRLPGRFVRWSWHKPRKLRMPESYADMDVRLGPAAFDPGKGEGILAVSPLFRDGRKDDPDARPKRVGFALVAKDEAGLEGLQAEFVRALGRAS